MLGRYIKWLRLIVGNFLSMWDDQLFHPIVWNSGVKIIAAWLYGRLIIPLYLLTFSRKIISSMKFFRSLVLSRIKYIEHIYFMFLYDLVSSQFIVIPIIIFIIKREEVLILRITNMPKLLVLFHVILVNTRNFVYLFQIPGGKYIIDIFSDVMWGPR